MGTKCSDRSNEETSFVRLLGAMGVLFWGRGIPPFVTRGTSPRTYRNGSVTVGMSQRSVWTRKGVFGRGESGERKQVQQGPKILTCR